MRPLRQDGTLLTFMFTTRSKCCTIRFNPWYMFCAFILTRLRTISESYLISKIAFHISSPWVIYRIPRFYTVISLSLLGMWIPSLILQIAITLPGCWIAIHMHTFILSLSLCKWKKKEGHLEHTHSGRGDLYIQRLEWADGAMFWRNVWGIMDLHCSLSVLKGTDITCCFKCI